MAPSKFPARQTKLASQSIARRHGLDDQRYLLIQQSPQAIDAGVFHNDVISVGHQNVLLCHEFAFINQPQVLADVQSKFQSLFDQPLFVVEFSDRELPLHDAVTSYLFNSQIVTRPDGGMTLVCPSECESTPTAKRSTERLLAEDNPIDQVLFLDLRQSMNNGGGPACLRLRVLLNDTQQAAIAQGVRLTDELYAQLVNWVEAHYRDQLSPDDLRDPSLLSEVETAFEQLASILGLARCH